MSKAASQEVTEQEKLKLKQQMEDKNSKMLNSGDGIDQLMVHNLENFAYRYLETELSKDIKCQKSGNEYFVTSIENSILELLKTNNTEFRDILKDLCKKYPGKESKNIQVQMKIATKFLSEDKVLCQASYNWSFPKFENQEFEISKEKTFEFTELIELRNKHAWLLEQVCELFDQK